MTQASSLTDDYGDLLITIEEDEEAHEDDLWFLPRSLEEEPDDLPPVSRLIPDFNCSRKLKLKRWNFTLALHQHAQLHSPAALVRFTLNLSRLRW